jgi:23S rRNA (pseudouridine1915-N3)-methyltransferase
MKIKLLFVGKTDEAWLKEAIEKYFNRLKNYLPVEMHIIPDIKNRNKLSIDQQKIQEGNLILKHIDKSEHVLLLDEKGRSYTSLEFSDFIQKKMNSGIKTLTLVIGGPYGFSLEVYQQIKQKISLSSLTFSHQMIRLLLVEQLYRAFSIINNEPYHHE